jgi:hypothetical protein
MPRTARQVKKTLDDFTSCNNKYKAASRKWIKSYAKFRKLSNSNPTKPKAIAAANKVVKKDEVAAHKLYDKCEKMSFDLGDMKAEMETDIKQINQAFGRFDIEPRDWASNTSSVRRAWKVDEPSA